MCSISLVCSAGGGRRSRGGRDGPRRSGRRCRLFRIVREPCHRSRADWGSHGKAFSGRPTSSKPSPWLDSWQTPITRNQPWWNSQRQAATRWTGSTRRREHLTAKLRRASVLERSFRLNCCFADCATPLTPRAANQTRGATVSCRTDEPIAETDADSPPSGYVLAVHGLLQVPGYRESRKGHPWRALAPHHALLWRAGGRYASARSVAAGSTRVARRVGW